MSETITKEQKQRLEKLDFKKLYVRNVPLGAVLNAETADSFPIIDVGCWVHLETNVQLIPTTIDGEYYLVPPEPNNKYGILESFHNAEILDEKLNFLETNKNWL